VTVLSLMGRATGRWSPSRTMMDMSVEQVGKETDTAKRTVNKKGNEGQFERKNG
jgi:hypothetical protein